MQSLRDAYNFIGEKDFLRLIPLMSPEHCDVKVPLDEYRRASDQEARLPEKSAPLGKLPHQAATPVFLNDYKNVEVLG